MCGALDVGLLNEKLADRKIIAGRAVGVRTIDDLLKAPLESVTYEARACGIEEGMIGEEALLKMIQLNWKFSGDELHPKNISMQKTALSFS